MLHLTEILFELSVLSMAFSFLLIYRVFEAAAHEPVIIKAVDSRNAIEYFSFLFITAISSLVILLIDNIFYHDSMPRYLILCSFIPAVFFIAAMILLYKLVLKMYTVIPDLIEAEKQSQIKKVDEEEVV